MQLACRRVKMEEKNEKINMEKAEKALQKLQKRYKRQNDYIEKTFDRVSVTLPKGTKKRIQKNKNGLSVNAFIKDAILKALEENKL